MLHEPQTGDRRKDMLRFFSSIEGPVGRTSLGAYLQLNVCVTITFFLSTSTAPPCFHSAFPFVSAGVFPCLDPTALPVLLLSRVGRLKSVR